MKRPFMVWIGFISICCSKVAGEGKSCPRLLVLQRVAQKLPSTIYLCLLVCYGFFKKFLSNCDGDGGADNV